MAKRGAPMPNDDSEYELMPAKVVRKLAKDVEAIKKDPLGSTPQGQELLAAVSGLSTTINDLGDMFKEASSSMGEEEEESQTVKAQLEPLIANVDDLIEQNKKIAKAIIAIADKVDEMKGAQERAPPPPMPRGPMPPPGMSRLMGLPSEPLLHPAGPIASGPGLQPAPLGMMPGQPPRWSPPPSGPPAPLSGPPPGGLPPPPGAPAKGKKKGLFSL